MQATLKNTVMAGLIALSSLSAAGAAQADSIELYLGDGSGSFALSESRRDRRGDDDGGRWRDDDDRHGWRDDDDRRGGWHDRRGRRACTPERALDKAQDLGFRRVSIERVGRETIRVNGRRWGERHEIVFARERNCPIIRIR